MAENPPTEESLRARLATLLHGGRSDGTRQQIAELVFELLRLSGRFLRDRNSDVFYFSNKTRIVYQINTRDFSDFIFEETRVNPAALEMKFVLELVRVYGRRNAERREVYRLSYFDEKVPALYLNFSPEEIIVVVPQYYEKLPNGSSDIFFAFDPNAEPLDVDLDIHDEAVDVAYSILVEGANFDNAERGTLNAEEQKHLYWMTLQLIFFLSARRTKPPIVVLGEPGSGKTTLLRKFGVVMVGEKFEVQSLTEDERDILTALSYRPFVVLDNVDKPTGFLNDLIAKVATGIAYHRRQLYTDNEEIVIIPRAHLAITSMQPYFDRADVADRILIFRLRREEGQEFLDEQELIDQVLQNRVTVIQGLILAIQKSLQNIESRKETKVNPTFRMADAARLLIKMSDNMEYMVSLLDKMQSEQTRFVAEGAALVEIICDWLGKLPQKAGDDFTTAQLFSELKSFSQDQRSDFPYKSVKSLGMALTNQKRALETRLDVKERKGSNNLRYFRFSVRPSGEGSLNH